MEASSNSTELNFAQRLASHKGRPIRNRMASARVTAKELETLERAAKLHGQLLGEWAREVLLREAGPAKEDALFTEIVATRMLLVNLFEPHLLGQTLTQENITEIMADVRESKHEAAREVMQQYERPEQVER